MCFECFICVKLYAYFTSMWGPYVMSLLLYPVMMSGVRLLVFGSVWSGWFSATAPDVCPLEFIYPLWKSRYSLPVLGPALGWPPFYILAKSFTLYLTVLRLMPFASPMQSPLLFLGITVFLSDLLWASLLLFNDPYWLTSFRGWCLCIPNAVTPPFLGWLLILI